MKVLVACEESQTVTKAFREAIVGQVGIRSAEETGRVPTRGTLPGEETPGGNESPMGKEACERRNMSDYIKREDVYDAIQTHYEKGVFKSYADGQQLMDRIAELPAADVVERKNGEWLTTDAFPHRVYCSCCYKTYIPNDRWQIWADGDLPRNFCPSCGADMREES